MRLFREDVLKDETIDNLISNVIIKNLGEGDFDISYVISRIVIFNPPSVLNITQGF